MVVRIRSECCCCCCFSAFPNQAHEYVHESSFNFFSCLAKQMFGPEQQDLVFSILSGFSGQLSSPLPLCLFLHDSLPFWS